MQIDEKLYAEIKQYCELNKLKIKPFISELLRNAFNREKFGDSPFQTPHKTKISIIEPEVNENSVTTFHEISNTNEEITSINVKTTEPETDKKEILNKTKKRKLN